MAPRTEEDDFGAEEELGEAGGWAQGLSKGSEVP